MWNSGEACIIAMVVRSRYYAVWHPYNENGDVVMRCLQAPCRSWDLVQSYLGGSPCSSVWMAPEYMAENPPGKNPLQKMENLLR